MKPKTEDLELGGNHYRLSKMDARTGSYIAAKVALLCSPMLRNGKVDTTDIAAVLPSLKREDFIELQNIVLKTITKLDMDNNGDFTLPMPIIDSSGNFVDEELAFDAGTVIALTIRGIMFNVGGFFGAVGLTQTKEAPKA